MLRINIIGPLLLLLFISESGFSQQKLWSLKECVDYALEYNINIQQIQLDSKLSELSKKDAIGNFLPSFNAAGSHSWNIGLNQNITTGLLENLTTQFTSLGLSSNVDIYKGLRNINTMHRANLALLANQYQLDKMKDDTSLLVANAYLQILFNKEQLKVQKGQNVVTKSNIKRTKELIKVGEIPKGDLLELEATEATQEQQIILTENNLFLSKISLAQLLQIKDYKNFEIVDVNYDLISEDILDQDVSVIIEKAKSELNNIKIAQSSTKLAEYDIEIAKGALLPTLTGFYSYSTRASYGDRQTGFEINPDEPIREIGFVDGTQQVVLGPNFRNVIEGPDAVFNQFSINDGHSFGVQLNIPILNGFSLKNNIERSKVAFERTKNQLEQTNLDLEANVYQVYNDAKNAKKAYEAAIKTVEARGLAFEYTNERYNIGVSNSFDLNQSKNQYENAQSDLIRSKYDYIFKLKILEFYFGIPITAK